MSGTKGDAAVYRLPAEYPTEVSIAEGMIAIRQEDALGNDIGNIPISPERVDLLIQMLHAVKEAILTERADVAEAKSVRSAFPPPQI